MAKLLLDWVAAAIHGFSPNTYSWRKLHRVWCRVYAALPTAAHCNFFILWMKLPMIVTNIAGADEISALLGILHRVLGSIRVFIAMSLTFMINRYYRDRQLFSWLRSLIIGSRTITFVVGAMLAALASPMAEQGCSTLCLSGGAGGAVEDVFPLSERSPV